MTSYKYISCLFAAALLFAFIAFYETYFSLFPSFKNTAWIIHFHATVIVLWFVMLITQPVLIRTGHMDLHRLLGRVSYILVPLLILSLILVSRKTQLRGQDLFIFAINIADSSLFVIYYLLAIYYRKKTSWHIRFMVLTIVPFIDPAAARLHLPGLAMQLTLISGLLILERFYGRIYKPYLAGLAVWIFITGLLAFLLFFNLQVMDKLWHLFFSR